MPISLSKFTQMKHFSTLFPIIFLIVLLDAGASFSQCSTITCTIPTPASDAREACILPAPSSLYGYIGTTSSTVPVSFPPYWCTTIENNQWFAFTADATTASFNISVFGCALGAGIQAAVLATSDCVDFTFVSACLGNIQSQSTQNLLASGLTIGQNYYLMIDGNAGAICDFAILETIPVETTAALPSETNIQIHPNPFHDVITISSSAALDNAELIVYNLFGQELKRVAHISGRNAREHLGGLEKGVYFATLQQAGKPVLQVRLISE